MQTEFKVADPDEIEMELTIKMPLHRWKELKTQLTSRDFPSWDLGRKITDMIHQAQIHFYPKESEKEI